MKKIACLLLFMFAGTANATVILNDFSITETNLTFNVSGTVTTLGSGYNHQILFGLVDDGTSDWITSFNAGASSWTDGATNARTTSSLYDLTGTYSDSLLTAGDVWQLGDLIDITFDFVGVFNLANFDVNNFGMSVGYSGGSIVDSNLNLVTGINTTSVPEPSTIALFAFGLAGLGFAKRKKAA